MRVDNRIFVPIITPFMLIWLTQAVFWLAGATISEPAALAMISLLFGPAIGAGIMALLFEKQISLGGFHLGRRK